MNALAEMSAKLDRMIVQVDEMLWASERPHEQPVCRGCGTLQRLRTPGCATCRKRHWKRARR